MDFYSIIDEVSKKEYDVDEEVLTSLDKLYKYINYLKNKGAPLHVIGKEIYNKTICETKFDSNFIETILHDYEGIEIVNFEELAEKTILKLKIILHIN